MSYSAPPPPPPGFPPPPPGGPGRPGQPVVPKTNVLSLVSLIVSCSLGVLGLCCFSPAAIAGGITGLVTGILGLRQVNASQGRETGRGLAIAGITVGSVALAVGLISAGLALYITFDQGAF